MHAAAINAGFGDLGKLSELCSCMLEEFVNCFDSAVTLRGDFERTHGIRLSVQTVRNRLHAANLPARRPVVRPPLTAHHCRCRLEFARQHVRIGRLPLHSILFTDETKFMLDFHDGRRRVWRQRIERFRDCCVAELDRFGGASVLVRAGMSYDGRTDLYVIRDGPLNAARYRDEVLHPFVRAYTGAVGQNFVLMDYNTRSHRGRVVQRYLEEQGIERIDWPARSPDFNPIAHAWDMLQQRISFQDRRPETAEELANLLTEEWWQIPRAE